MPDPMEFFRGCLREIENEFGRPFLEKKSDSDLQPIGKGQHPIRYHWRVASRFLRGVTSVPADLGPCPSLAIVAQFAHSLGLARDLPGFETEIRKRLKDWSTFRAAEFEMETACSYKLIGDVEFIPREPGRRTPDLKISHDGESLWVECHRKDPITPVPPPVMFGQQLYSVISDSIKDLPLERNVTILTVCHRIDAFAEAIQEAKRWAATGYVGGLVEPGMDAQAIIGETIPRPSLPQESAGIGLTTLSAHSTLSVFSAELGLNSNGEPVVRSKRNLDVRCLESHRFNEVLNSFNEKRKQIPEGSLGILHFDVDLSSVALANYENYLQLISSLLASRVWQGGQNSRIGGFCLSGNPPVKMIQYHGWNVVCVEPFYCLVPNPNVELPGWLTSRLRTHRRPDFPK